MIIRDNLHLLTRVGATLRLCTLPELSSTINELLHVFIRHLTLSTLIMVFLHYDLGEDWNVQILCNSLVET